MTSTLRRSLTLALALLMTTLTGCSALERAARELSQRPGAGELDQATVIAGLRDALRVGSVRTVESIGRTDGFLGNGLIRIALPESYRNVATTLRRVGMGKRVDELEVAMNRAAEQAAGEAKTVLWDAVQSMSIADGFRILRGTDTAATDYFRERTSASIERRFRPIVEDKMRQVGLYRLHRELSDSYLKLPFSRREHLVEMDSYVTDKAMAGLFTVLAQEEQRIRRDPAARTTALLKQVFGRE